MDHAGRRLCCAAVYCARPVLGRRKDHHRRSPGGDGQGAGAGVRPGRGEAGDQGAERGRVAQDQLLRSGAESHGLLARHRPVDRAAPGDDAIKSFESLFASGKPRCGQIRDVQRDYLFGTDAMEIGSVALAPLGSKGSLGLLAIGASDAERFHPGMSTEFLSRIGELLTDLAPDLVPVRKRAPSPEA